MADMVSPGGTAPAPHHLPERDAALDTNFERELLQYDFTPPSFLLDVNDEDSRLQECLDTDGRLPLPELLSPSRATSYRTNTTSESQCGPWTPEDVRLRSVKSDAAGDNATEWHMSFDDLVRPDAPEPSPVSSPDLTTHTPIVNAAIAHPPELTQTSYFEPGAGGSGWTTEASPILGDTFAQPPTRDPFGRSQSLSKRGRQDTSGTLNGLTRKPSKRHKQVPGGFPCDNCDDKFDRACDQAKHFKRAHGGDDCKPHSCSECNTMGQVKKFLYPKDLRRHLKQVHMIITHKVAHSRPADASENTSPTSPTSPHAATFWTLTKAVQRFKQLRLSSLSPNESHAEEQYIMVSADQHHFVDVDVTGITAADVLVTRILTSLKMADAAVNQVCSAQTYKKSRGLVQLGDKLDLAKLLSLINRSADSQGSLKVVVHISRPLPLPITAEARMFAQQ